MLSKPSWRSWLARQSHNLKVVSSSLTEGILLCPQITLSKFAVTPLHIERYSIFKAKIEQF